MTTVTRCIPAFQRGLWVVAIFLLLFSYSSAQDSSFFRFVYQKNGPSQGAQMGYEAAKIGDINGDCKSDFIIGAPGDGMAFVYSGANGNLLFQLTGTVGFGSSVAGIGKLWIAIDTIPDFAVGNPFAAPGGRTNAGSVYFYSGATGAFLFQKDGATSGNQFGTSIDGVGDLNADGSSDFIIGAPSPMPSSGAGSAYVFSGAFPYSLLFQKNGTTSGDEFGVSVAGAGKVDTGATPDFIVGARLADPGGLSNAGSAYVYSGASGAPLLYQKNGQESNDQFGRAVDGAGDINSDGRADFIVGAPFADPIFGTTDVGSVYVYSGADGTTLLYQKNGGGNGDHFGVSVAGAGDANGDQRVDFIIGAPGTDPGGLSSAGSAYLYSGVNGSLLFQKDGSAAVDELGSDVNMAGDVNADEHSDIIIGAPGADPGGFLQAGSAFVYGDSCEHSVRGDMDGSGDANPSDVVKMQNCVYQGTGNCDLCFADTNCDGALTPADVTNELNWVYGGVPMPCTSPCLP